MGRELTWEFIDPHHSLEVYRLDLANILRQVRLVSESNVFPHQLESCVFPGEDFWGSDSFMRTDRRPFSIVVSNLANFTFTLHTRTSLSAACSFSQKTACCSSVMNSFATPAVT